MWPTEVFYDGYDPPVTYMKLTNLKKVDVFSFGVTVAAMCTHNVPFETELSGGDLLKEVALGRLQPQMPQGLPHMSELVTLCTGIDAERRPTFHQIAQRLTREISDELNDWNVRCHSDD